MLAHADEPVENIAKGKWEFSGTLSNTSLDQTSASQSYIDDQSWSIGATADYDKNRWLTTIGMELIRYDDNAGFTQRTVNNFGSENNSRSNASGLLISMAFGPKWHFAKDQSATVFIQGGFAQMIESDRGIASCTDCYEESIDIDGGIFFRAGVLKNVGSISLGLQAIKYLSADVDRSIGLVVSTAY